MKVVCVSDLHEHLVDIPPCDLLLIAGDVSFAPFNALGEKQRFLETKFVEWLRTVPATDIVLVAGNHDQSIEQWGVPDLQGYADYLEDDGAAYGDSELKVWGTPWQPWFFGWAFNAPQHDGEEFLARKFSGIPDDTDIIICHGPPHQYGDRTARGEHVGSTALLARIDEVKPKLVVCGHIHPAYGVYRRNGTVIVNASVVNEAYEPVNPPVELEV